MTVMDTPTKAHKAYSAALSAYWREKDLIAKAQAKLDARKAKAEAKLEAARIRVARSEAA